MEREYCLSNNHQWRFVSLVQGVDGKNYSLAMCLKCGAESRCYENGREEITQVHLPLH